MLDYTGIPKDNRMSWNITIYICIWSNKHIISNGDITYNDCIYPYPYTIANFGYSFSFASIFLPNSNAFV